jgi:hypothetical protein
MANKKRFSKASVKRAIEGSRGNLTTVADTLNCTRQTVHNYLQRYPDLRDSLEQERESLVDLAENKLAKLIDDGVLGAVLFTLETMGKNRGWTKKTEIAWDWQGELKNMGIDPDAAVNELAEKYKETLRAGKASVAASSAGEGEA